MIIAAAQTNPKRFDTESNLKDHIQLSGLAADHGADLILFPEMSITGYEREKASSLAFQPKDVRLESLQELANNKAITIIAGAPIKMENNMFIGTFIISPNDKIQIYTKQYLHEGEDVYFNASFDFNPLLEIEDQKISLATCFDIENQKHIQAAYQNKSALYLASIFYLPGSMNRAHNLLSGYAQQYGIQILMSNFCGMPWGCDSGGQSAFWDKNGNMIGSLDSKNPGLLLVEKLDDQWSSKSFLCD